MIVEDLTTFLRANAGIAAIAGAHVFWNFLPQKSGITDFLPGVVCRQVSGRRPLTMDGRTGLADARFTFECRASDYLTCKSLAAAVRIALLAAGGTTIGATSLGSVELLGERDGYYDLSLQHHADLDFRIWHRET